MNPIISFEKVSFSYGDLQVLENASFQIQSGEFVGIFGPNGGGKTTLLKLMMGFLEPDGGRISILGKDPDKCLADIAYVPQRLAFDKQFPISVQELVLGGRLSHLPWWGRFSQDEKKLAIEALKKVRLEEHAHRQFGSLSGGQIQRALIARALVSNPKVLLLDEPTAGVDPQSEDEIYTLLKELKGSMTILMVTHHLNSAIGYVDRMLCVQKEVIPLQTKEVCEHHAMGLYHPPLQKENES